MVREVKIDRAVYIADDKRGTYTFFKSNPNYMQLRKDENEKNKQSINGYARIFKNGTKKIYKRSEHR